MTSTRLADRLNSRRRSEPGRRWVRIVMAVLATIGALDTGSITLNQSSNDFGGPVSATTTGGAGITLTDANSIALGAISASGAACSRPTAPSWC